MVVETQKKHSQKFQISPLFDSDDITSQRMVVETELYDLLGVSSNADDNEIKKACKSIENAMSSYFYFFFLSLILSIFFGSTFFSLGSTDRKASLANHPDKNPGDADASRRFQEVSTAYETLSDPDTRAAYDRYGMDGITGRGGMGGPPDMDDLFGKLNS